mgnify:CR=1 FL=1
MLSLSVVKKMPEDLVGRLYQQYDIVRTLESRLNERDVRKEKEIQEEPQSSQSDPPRVEHRWSLLLLALFILLSALQIRRSGFDASSVTVNFAESVGRFAQHAAQYSKALVRKQISDIKRSMENAERQKSDLENEAITAFLELEWKWKVENEGLNGDEAEDEEVVMEADELEIDGGEDELEGKDDSELERELEVRENELEVDGNPGIVANETVESRHESGDNESFVEDSLFVIESVMSSEVSDDSEATEMSVNELDRVDGHTLDFEEKAEVAVKEEETEVITEQTEPQSEISAVDLDGKMGEEGSASEESDSAVEAKLKIPESLAESTVMKNNSVDDSMRAENEQSGSIDHSEPQTNRPDAIQLTSSEVAPNHVSTNSTLATSSTESRNAIGTDYIVSHLLLRYIRTVFLTVSSRQRVLLSSRCGIFGASTASHRCHFYRSAYNRY